MVHSLNLHTADSRADWESVTPKNRNFWQKQAARSNGILAPANLVSLAGAGITIFGLVRLTQDLSFLNILIIVVGRMADLLDGYIADKTGTKSPVGEAVDASIDKLLALVAIAALWTASLVPIIVLILIAIQNIFNGLISTWGKASGRGLHPTFEGKVSMAAGWGVLVTYPLYHLLDSGSQLSAQLCLAATYVLLIVFITLGGYSMFTYYKQWQSKGEIQ